MSASPSPVDPPRSEAPRSEAPRIELLRLSKWYGEVLGLNEVTAEIGPGVTGLLGPNGAGKSTLLKLICGMLAPSLGEVRVAGEEPFDNPGVMRRVGLCAEQDAAYPGIAAWPTLTYLTRLHGFGRAEARDLARRALERVGLGAVLDRSLGTFSKGMRQRFKLAQALAHDPDIVVLDEPLNGLDPTARRDLTELIRALGEEGRCVVVSSHVLHEVETLARRSVFLYQGRVLAEGTREEVRRELPEHPLQVRLLTPTPRPLAQWLLEAPGVLRVTTDAQGVEVLTTQAEGFFDHLQAAAASAASAPPPPITAVLPGDEDLEAVFRYLTR